MSLKSAPVPEEDAVLREPGFVPVTKRKTMGPAPKPRIQYDDPKAAKESLERLSRERPLKPPGKYPYTIGRHRSG